MLWAQNSSAPISEISLCVFCDFYVVLPKTERFPGEHLLKAGTILPPRPFCLSLIFSRIIPSDSRRSSCLIFRLNPMLWLMLIGLRKFEMATFDSLGVALGFGELEMFYQGDPFPGLCSTLSCSFYVGIAIVGCSSCMFRARSSNFGTAT